MQPPAMSPSPSPTDDEPLTLMFLYIPRFNTPLIYFINQFIYGILIAASFKRVLCTHCCFQVTTRKWSAINLLTVRVLAHESRFRKYFTNTNNYLNVLFNRNFNLQCTSKWYICKIFFISCKQTLLNDTIRWWISLNCSISTYNSYTFDKLSYN